MLGIGLGGFASTFDIDKSIGIADKLDERSRRRKSAADLDAATAAGRADYDKAVASGQAKPDDARALLHYALPHLMWARVKNQDFDGGMKMSTWLQSKEAREGARLFGSAMRRAHVGDIDGAWSDFTKLGKLKGYGGDYDLGPLQRTPEGGFTTTIKAPDGKQYQPAFKSWDDVKLFMATYGNPEAAGEDLKQQQADLAKRKGNVWEHGEKKRSDIATDLERRKAGLPLGSGAGDGLPAEARMIEYLVQSKIMPDRKTAAEWVRRSKSNPDAERLRLIGQLTRAGQNPEEAVAAADNIMRQIAPQGGAQSAPPAPRDPAQRKVGQVYTVPDGRSLSWTGKGWELIEKAP